MALNRSRRWRLTVGGRAVAPTVAPIGTVVSSTAAAEEQGRGGKERNKRRVRKSLHTGASATIVPSTKSTTMRDLCDTTR